MKLFIESRVCVDLGINYNEPGTGYEVTMKDFIESWNRNSREPFYISVDGSRVELSKARERYPYLFNDILKLKNTGSGWFEVL